jgi:hypothetical protein
VYDYLNDAGDAKWYLPAPWYSATQLGVGSTTIAADAVVRKATLTAPPLAPLAPATPASTSTSPKAKPKAAPKPASTTTASK